MADFRHVTNDPDDTLLAEVDLVLRQAHDAIEREQQRSETIGWLALVGGLVGIIVAVAVAWPLALVPWAVALFGGVQTAPSIQRRVGDFFTVFRTPR